MTNLVGRTLYRLGERLPGRVSTPSDHGYAAATAIWSKPVGRMPRAVVHCQTGDDLRLAFAPPAIAVFRCPCASEGTIGLVAPCATASSST